ncbi:MAG: PIN domain-containing protein [Selenomonadaceae bacterium]|nr:PIN domain-containing protein [Selenomonadaceae bacterium]
MQVLLDTNILMDYLTEREPFFHVAHKIVLWCKNKQYDGVVAAHSIVDMFFILRKHFTNAERRQMLLAFLEILKVESIDEEKLRLALRNEPFTDFEDCLQVECAKSAQVDYIITRNEKDYALSDIPVLSPEQFVEKFS